MTSNPVAQALIGRACSRCKGCRTSWRLDGWTHRGPDKIECTAQQERQTLRDLVAAAKARLAALNLAGAFAGDVGGGP